VSKVTAKKRKIKLKKRTLNTGTQLFSILENKLYTSALFSGFQHLKISEERY
jgi:hypothetical protein